MQFWDQGVATEFQPSWRLLPQLTSLYSELSLGIAFLLLLIRRQAADFMSN